ncbi:MAG: VCBS repeat-containing protein, partial [Bacteroidota bacterium]
MKKQIILFAAFAALTFNFQLSTFNSFAQTPYTFKDVTDSVGLVASNDMQAAWGDYDNDGWVDLFRSGEVLHNIKGDTFVLNTLSTIASGLPGTWGDYDNDGYLDIFS